MGEKSEIFVTADLVVKESGRQSNQKSGNRLYRDLLEITLVFGFILAAIWTPPGRPNSAFVILSMLSVLGFAVCGRWNVSSMGLTRPRSGSGKIILIGGFFCIIIALLGIPLRFAGPGYHVPLAQSAAYAIWALEQEFILQAIFFLRFESMFGGRRAVFAAASVYAVAHLPSPILTVLSILGGILFCELFRRWRNLYPLGLIHAALGVTIAASFPDKWMHHMRVGIGYLTHP